MLGLFFDVLPKPGHMSHYFEHVKRLKPILARHPGLLYLERFRPLDNPQALLSHQHWADEAALAAWRRDASHRASQAAGRKIHFDAYVIEVGAQVEAMEGPGRYRVTIESAAPFECRGGRIYESVTRPGRFLTVCARSEGAAAQEVCQTAHEAGFEATVFAISRSYSLADRAEAPRD